MHAIVLFQTSDISFASQRTQVVMCVCICVCACVRACAYVYACVRGEIFENNVSGKIFLPKKEATFSNIT
jgi:hypothetical protein